MLKNKSIGFYFVLAAGVSAIVSIIYFLIWAPSHNAMDTWIIVPLIGGLALDILLIFYESDYFIVLSTALYSISVAKLLTNSVGSFVDAFQGINMFGDATQVNTIIYISIIMLVSVLFSIMASFLKRVKD